MAHSVWCNYFGTLNFIEGSKLPGEGLDSKLWLFSISSALNRYSSSITQILSRQLRIPSWCLSPRSSPGTGQSGSSSLIYRFPGSMDPWIGARTTVWAHGYNLSCPFKPGSHIPLILSLNILTSCYAHGNTPHSYTLYPCSATLRFLNMARCF